MVGCHQVGVGQFGGRRRRGSTPRKAAPDSRLSTFEPRELERIVLPPVKTYIEISETRGHHGTHVLAEAHGEGRSIARLEADRQRLEEENTRLRLELKERYGKSVATVLARLDGKSVGFIANNPMFKGGALDGGKVGAGKPVDRGHPLIAMMAAEVAATPRQADCRPAKRGPVRALSRSPYL